MTGERPAIGRWIVAVTVGEAVGFAVAAAIAVVVTVSGMNPALGLLLIVSGGAVEGALLGIGQVVGLGRFAPARRRWIGATSAGAAAAWGIGLMPSTIGLNDLTPAVIPLVALGAVLLLSMIPVAQWLAIRHRPRSLRWVPASMGSWAVAAAWTAAPSPFIDEGSPLALVAGLYVVAGLLMALTIASLTAPLARSVFTAGPRN
ncbi:hypothetical protein GCM10009840_23260 [Pseudolysinimonas kribbensis]|uniref:Uncharacterized protein n=1 Tax=Pseudolysinimonas kribbensis TaxID=433641 RepID=A0ABQ6K949_9MICO|nr:hypothetical protein [Pseudolysinimonas kribbensis]GMA96929.1 hypothetical protein GCM10025881_37530 [Pseudolysinimonas kribbensis]